MHTFWEFLDLDENALDVEVESIFAKKIFSLYYIAEVPDILKPNEETEKSNTPCLSSETKHDLAQIKSTSQNLRYLQIMTNTCF